MRRFATIIASSTAILTYSFSCIQPSQTTPEQTPTFKTRKQHLD